MLDLIAFLSSDAMVPGVAITAAAAGSAIFATVTYDWL